jgi:hypothetical protein
MTESENSVAPALAESIARRLAQLAKVPESSFGRFYELLVWQLIEAHLANQHLGRAAAREITRAPDIKDSLSRVSAAAQDLDKELAALLLGENASAALAGSLLGTTFAASDVTASGSHLIAYRASLATLIDTARKAGKLADDWYPPKRRRGRPPNLVFNHFVYRLYEIVRQTRGKGWTHYRKSCGNWSGTLMEALGLLRDHLPDFFPEGDLGNTLERLPKDVRKRLTEEYGPGGLRNDHEELRD